MTAAAQPAAPGATAAGDDDRLFPMRPILAASCAVVRDGRVLIARRGRPPMAQVWSLPGGLVEVGEHLAEAALRELMEEVGVGAEIGGVAGHVEHIEWDTTSPGRRVRRHFVIVAFAARWRDGEPAVSAEAAEVAWATPAEIAALPTTDRLPEIAARAVELMP
ncbi:NUDIX hydrolase [Chelatococcus reniformis]|uniref:NUDIX hydrolase n=1 Tax=Chelatococcus reniformis TaxID=1494448 RepID=A0A916U792_9HYPH|nr:NUDIX hydrolase [Chelatococcus reniformis]GGC61714.1 NUDIX hydrolase [Chelatococcus reniformis]